MSQQQQQQQQRGLVPAASGQDQVQLLAQQRTMEQRSSASSTTIRESHTRAHGETRVSQQTFTSQQQSTNTTHRGTVPTRPTRFHSFFFFINLAPSILYLRSADERNSKFQIRGVRINVCSTERERCLSGLCCPLSSFVALGRVGEVVGHQVIDAAIIIRKLPRKMITAV